MALGIKNLMKIQGIKLGYGAEPVIAGLSLEIHSGSMIGLIGPNGAGKTTLLLSLSGQFKPQQGGIRCENSDVYERNIEFKSRIGYVHENPFFYGHLRVEEFMAFVARIKNVRRSEIKSQISVLLQSVCLEEEREKFTADLSLGMKKKLAIAAALLGNPRIVFLDEALNGVDVESAFHIKRILKDRVAKGGTVILATHALEVVEKICDRYLVLKNGRIIADLKASTFRKADYRKKYVDLEHYVMSLLK